MRFLKFDQRLKTKLIENDWVFSNYLMVMLSKLEFLTLKKWIKDKIGNNFISSNKPLIITLKPLKLYRIKIFNKKAKVIELTHGAIICDNNMVVILIWIKMKKI